MLSKGAVSLSRKLAHARAGQRRHRLVANPFCAAFSTGQASLSRGVDCTASLRQEDEEDGTRSPSLRTKTQSQGMALARGYPVGRSVASSWITRSGLQTPRYRWPGALNLHSSAAFSSTSSSHNEKKEDNSEKSSSSPRLEARFGKVGKFFDSLGEEVSKEMSKNEQVKSGLDEMKQRAAELRKSAIGDKKVDDVLNNEKVEKAREQAQDAASKAAEEARKQAERIAKSAEEAGSKFSSSFDSLKEKVSEKTSESEFVKKAKKKAEDAQAAAEKVTDKVDVSEKSLLGRFFGAVKETIEEAKEDILGDASRGSDGRRKAARRKRKADEEGMRRVAQTFGMRGGRRMIRRKKAKSGAAVQTFTDEQMAEAFSQVDFDAEGQSQADHLSAALKALNLEVPEENFEAMVQSAEDASEVDLDVFKRVVNEYLEAAAGSEASQGNAGGADWEEEVKDTMIDDPDWETAVDPDSGDTYYYNVKTGDTSWDKPEQIPNPNISAKPKDDGINGELGSDDDEEFRDWKSPEEEARGKSRYGRDDEMIMVEEEESSWQRIKERLTATPIIQDILGASSEGVRSFAKTDAGKRARKRLKKGRNKIEDMQEQWETSQNPYVFALASAYDEMFAETPEGQAIKELRRLDNDFVLDEWLLDVEDDIAPLMLEAYITGNEKLMDGICADTCKAMVGAAIADRKQNGFVMDPTILDIRGANLMAARPLEKAPPLMVVGFQAQQVHCITDKEGIIVEGADDKVTNNFYILCMQRDWDEQAGELQWKIIEFSLMMQMDYV